MSIRDATASPLHRWALLAVLLLGTALRGFYIWHVPVTHDEYASLWASQHVWTTGTPQLPSGFVYWQGWLFTYLIAPVELLFHPSAWVMRLPALLVGVASILLVYHLGRLLIDRETALVAAFAWATMPIAIVAGGQARMYAFLDLFGVLAAASLVRWLRDGRPSAAGTFVLSVIGAVASQTVAVFLLPGLAMIGLLEKGWRWWLQPRRLIPWIACAAASGGALALNQIGGPVASAARRPYIAFGPPWHKTGFLLTVLEFARSPQGWLIAGGLLTGLALTTRELRARRAGPVTLLFAAWLPGYLLFAFAVGGTWQRTRYVQMLFPFVLLIGAAAILCILKPLRPRRGRTAGWPAMATGALLAFFWLAALIPALSEPGIDHAAAYRFIQMQSQRENTEGIVLTGLPVIAGYFRGGADGYVLQRDFQEYVVRKNGSLVDRWTGAPLLTSAWDVGDAIADARGAWFVVVTNKLPMLYRPDFIAYLDEVMEPVFLGRGVTVYHTRAQAEYPMRRRVSVVWTDARQGVAHITLVGYERPRAPLVPGSTLRLALHWQTDRRLRRGLTAFIHVLDHNGHRVAQADGPPSTDILITNWPIGQPVRGRFAIPLPANLAPGSYRLFVGLYDPDTMQRLTIASPADTVVDNGVLLDRVLVTAP